MAHALPETGRHPGWPARLGALRTAGGVVELRPVWLRDGPAWSEVRLRDERHLAPWEPTPPGGWTARHPPAEWPGRWWTLRAAARRGSVLPFAITVDGALAGHVMIGNVVREPLLSAYVGYWCDTRRTGRGVTTAGRRAGRRPLLRARRAAPPGGDGPSGERRQPARARQARVPRGGAVPPLPRRRRRVARPPLLRDDGRGAADGRHRRTGRGVGVGRAGLMRALSLPSRRKTRVRRVAPGSATEPLTTVSSGYSPSGRPPLPVLRRPGEEAACRAR